MNRSIWRWAAVLLTAAAAHGQTPEPSNKMDVPRGSLTNPPQGSDWANLLDEDHATGWRANVSRSDLFEIRDSALHIFGSDSGAYIGYMQDRLRDFALHVEFKLMPRVNSGIMLRADAESPELTGVEIQILDDCGRVPTRNSCGALYGIATPMFNMSFAQGRWNSLDITLQGRRLEVLMNGWKILDIDGAKMTMPVGDDPVPLASRPLDGFLMFQDLGGEVWYRNIFLKQL